MNHLPTLTKARRDEILARLTPVQRQALNQFTMYEMKSWFHTKIFQTAIDWEFQGGHRLLLPARTFPPRR